MTDKNILQYARMIERHQHAIRNIVDMIKSSSHPLANKLCNELVLSRNVPSMMTPPVELVAELLGIDPYYKHKPPRRAHRRKPE